jgi:hypothetical protein
VTGRILHVPLEADDVWVHWISMGNWTGLENPDWARNNLMESFYWTTNKTHAMECQSMETLFLTSQN